MKLLVEIPDIIIEFGTSGQYFAASQYEPASYPDLVVESVMVNDVEITPPDDLQKIIDNIISRVPFSETDRGYRIDREIYIDGEDLTADLIDGRVIYAGVDVTDIITKEVELITN